MRYPDGYWTTVTDRACYLQDKTPSLDGNTAYDLARLQVDKEIMEKQRQLRLLDAHYPGLSNAKA